MGRVCLAVAPGKTRHMNHTEQIQKHQGGPHLDGSKPHRPYWKRAHHSVFFWVAAFFILVAMGVFVMTDGFLLRPRSGAQVSDHEAAQP